MVIPVLYLLRPRCHRPLRSFCLSAHPRRWTLGQWQSCQLQVTNDNCFNSQTSNVPINMNLMRCILLLTDFVLAHSFTRIFKECATEAQNLTPFLDFHIKVGFWSHPMCSFRLLSGSWSTGVAAGICINRVIDNGSNGDPILDEEARHLLANSLWKCRLSWLWASVSIQLTLPSRFSLSKQSPPCQFGRCTLEKWPGRNPTFSLSFQCQFPPREIQQAHHPLKTINHNGLDLESYAADNPSKRDKATWHLLRVLVKYSPFFRWSWTPRIRIALTLPRHLSNPLEKVEPCWSWTRFWKCWVRRPPGKRPPTTAPPKDKRRVTPAAMENELSPIRVNKVFIILKSNDWAARANKGENPQKCQQFGLKSNCLF